MTAPPGIAAPAFLLVAHGSSDPGWAAPLFNLKAAVQAKNPGSEVELAFMERMQPTFADAAMALRAKGIVHVIVVPVFLAIGGHIRKDLPRLVEDARAQTGIEFTVLPTLGEADALIGAIADWVTAAAP